MVQPVTERRRYERSRVAAIAIVWTEDRAPYRYLVDDLSASGARLIGGPLLAVRQGIGLSLHVAGVHLLDLRGEVIRQPGGRALAVAFRAIKPADEDTIHQTVLGALEAFRRGECPPRHVLVVDDSESVCRALQNDLAELGHHVVCARSGAQATARIRDPYVRFDIAVVDLSVGSIEGLDLLQEVSSLHPGVHRVLMSGRVSREQLKLAEVMGRADVILPKPWTRRSLLAVLPI